MKVLIFSDIHWSQNTSILRSYGERYSTRLELLVSTMDWINRTAVERGCSAMVCAGDMMDRSDCNDMELTALGDIRWNPGMPCYFLVGNHESSVMDLRYTTLKPLESETKTIIGTPTGFTWGGSQVHFVPYVTEDMRKPLKEYLHNVDRSLHQVVISHNDIKGIRYGKYESRSGFGLDEIEGCCDLYLNGHIHNGSRIGSKVVNLGSSTAHNFSNDSSRFNYGIWILDTDTLGLEFIENPYSLNFYKFDISSKDDMGCLGNLRNHAIVSARCPDSIKEEVREALVGNPHVILHKLIVSANPVGDSATGNSAMASLGGLDYMERFREFIMENMGKDAIVMEELGEVCKQ